MVIGLVDQQLNGANPAPLRLQGRVRRRSRPTADKGDVVLYEPYYLAEVVALLRAGPDQPASSAPRSPTTSTVWVVATERVLTPRRQRRPRSGTQLADLEQGTARWPTRSSAAERHGCWELAMSTVDRPPIRPAAGRADVGRRRADARRAHPGHGARRRQHGRPRRVLLVAAAARPRRQPVAVRRCSSSPSCSTSSRRSGSGGRACRATAPRRRRRRRSMPTPRAARRRRVHPHLQRAGRRSSRPTVVAAMRMRGAHVRVALLDDGDRDEMERMATRHGARYVRRPLHDGAKAGNINHALGRTDAPFVLVLDCDHVPYADMLEATLPEFADRSRGLRADAAVLRQPRRRADRRRGVEPAGAVLRRRSPGARTATARCSAAARTSCSAAPRWTTSAGSRRAR